MQPHELTLEELRQVAGGARRLRAEIESTPHRYGDDTLEPDRAPVLEEGTVGGGQLQIAT